ncbi:MAG: TVP38/TMEM64 family protein [Fuerstiella sp.]
MDDLQPPPATRKGLVVRVIVGAAVVAVVTLLFFQYRESLTLTRLAENEAVIRDYKSEHPWLAYGVAMLAYVVVAGLSLPGAVPLTLVIAWIFGFARGLLVVSFGSTAGATVAFLLSRYLLRQSIQTRFADRLVAVNESLKTEGPFYLFTLRLIPAIPFFVINVVMGLTGIPVSTFWWVSQLGMLPGTAVYVYAGSRFPDLNTLAKTGASGILSPSLIVAFVALGLFPVVVRKIMSLRKA